MKKKLTGVLALCLLAGTITAPAAAATNRENNVECVLQMLTKKTDCEYAWDTDGGREVKTNIADPQEERVWGWSTCYDKYGKETRHYTHSRYETLLGSSSRDEWSSGRIWGTGEVWAYSPYIGYSVAGELKARVYYGL